MTGGIQVAVICPQAVHSAMTCRGAGVAGVNGIIAPEVVAEHVIDALESKRFLILPHPEGAHLHSAQDIGL